MSNVYNTKGDCYIGNSFGWFGDTMITPQLVENYLQQVPEEARFNSDNDEEIAQHIINYYFSRPINGVQLVIPDFERKAKECGFESNLLANYQMLFPERDYSTDYHKQVAGFDILIDVTNGEYGDFTHDEVMSLYTVTEISASNGLQVFVTKVTINGKKYSIALEYADGGWNAFFFKSSELK